MDNYRRKLLNQNLSEAGYSLNFLPNKDVGYTVFKDKVEIIANILKLSLEETFEWLSEQAKQQADKFGLETENLKFGQHSYISYSDRDSSEPNPNYHIPPLDIFHIESQTRYFLFLPTTCVYGGELRYNTENYIDFDKSLKEGVLKARLYSEDIGIVINMSELKSSQDPLSVDNEFKNFENFNDVEFPEYKNVYGDDFNISVVNEDFDIENYDDITFETVSKLLLKSDKAFQELQNDSEKGNIEDVFWTFDEIDKTYNVGISTNQKRAFVIYWQNKVGKELKGDFHKKYGSPFPTPRETVVEMLVSGNMFFDGSAKIGDRLQPKPIFLSGNIWRKKLYLENNGDDIIKRFGEDVYKNHLKEINEVFKSKVQPDMLKVTGDEKKRMILTPVSPLAQTTYISGIINPNGKEDKNEFEVAIQESKGEVKEDILNLKDYSNRDKFVQKSEVKLQDGFLKWLKLAGEGKSALKYGVQWGTTTINVTDLVRRYIRPTNNPYGKTPKDIDKWNREKDDAKITGERLFKEFLAVGLFNEKHKNNDQLKIEVLFNQKYNSLLDIDLNQIPIGFTYKKYLDNLYSFSLREFNLRAIRYYLSRGSVGLAYGVGIGKTFCSVFCMKQALDLGLAERILVSVPNQVYFQFAKEIERGLGKEYTAGNKLNMMFNGLKLYVENANNPVNGINLCTYSAISNMTFQKETLYRDDKALERRQWVEDALNFFYQGGDNVDVPEFQKLIDEKLNSQFNFDDDTDSSEKLAKGGAVTQPIFIDKSNYDFIVIDEVHNFNALFTKVDAPVRERQTGSTVQRDKTRYSSIRETQGKDSARASNLFWICKYIQSTNKNWNNTVLLSATPFTNSPLQVYSMFAFLNTQILKETYLDSILAFFDTFSNIAYAEDVTTSLQIRKINKFVGWINIVALQKLLYYVFDKSSKEEEDKQVVRPQKLVLPLKNKMVNGEIIRMKQENFVSTTLMQSKLQENLWEKIKDYAQTPEMEYEKICNEDTRNTTSYSNYPKPAKKDEDTVEVEDADALSDGTKDGEKAKRNQKALQSLQWGRELTLSPYFYRCSGLKTEPTAEDFVETSPKILYAVKCIESCKKYHQENNSPMSGQVIYYDYKIESMKLIRDYLVDKLDFNINEIGIITGKGNFIGKKGNYEKQEVANAFMGRKQNEETGQFSDLENDKDRVKILLGSRAIREGINLQNYSTVLYNLFLDFNPTDQVQLEGRIWRQGNAFSNVRIVIPLMANSIDVFMFQKLEDKTTRINQIWTRDGQKNEIDTDSFDPSELKYELLSDPEAIAQLEIEDKIKEIDSEIGFFCSDLSTYQEGEQLIRKSDEILYQRFTYNNTNQDIIKLYFLVANLRPDLVFEKPLVNEKNLAIYLDKALPTTAGRNIPPNLSDIYTLYRNNDYEVSSPQYNLFDKFEMVNQKENFNKLFNYTYDELNTLMLQILKEKKIGYPIGYSKNWRDLKEEQPNYPFLGDTVKYETKRGSKTGKVTAIFNDGGLDLSEYAKAELDNIKKNQFDKDFENNIEEAFMPMSIEIDEKIEKENNEVELVVEQKKVKPTKYPEPFTYSNKDRDKILTDIKEYLVSKIGENNNGALYDNDSTSILNKSFNEIIDKDLLVRFYMSKNNLFTILTNDMWAFQDNSVKELIDRGTLPKLWTDFADRDNTIGRYDAFSYSKSKIIAESKIEIPKLFERLNISSVGELDNLITQVNVDINEKEIEKNSFSDEQVFAEIVQEVVRKQQELLGEFERQGNTYGSRVKDFATANDEYGGNNLLSEFFDDIEPYEMQSDKSFKVYLENKRSIDTDKKDTKTSKDEYSKYTEEQAKDLREIDQAIEEIRELVKDDLVEKEELDNLIETKTIIIETYNI